MLSKVCTTKSSHQPDSSTETEATEATETNTVSAEDELVAVLSASAVSNAALEALQERVIALEEQFKSFKENLMDDTAYQTDVSDLNGWLARMESKIATNNDDIATTQESDVDSGKGRSEKPEETTTKKETKVIEKPKKAKEDAVIERLEEEAGFSREMDEILCDGPVVEVSSQVILSAPELQATNEKLKNLGYTLNEQLHALRDKVFLVDHELKRMAKGVEFALMRSKAAGNSDMVSKWFIFKVLLNWCIPML
jgi:hypothetical protein